MAAISPPRTQEHWLCKLDKKMDLVPVVGTATNVTKLFIKLIFKTLEKLLPKISRPITSSRIVRAITTKKTGTYIFHAIPFWFVLDAMARIGSEQRRRDEERRQAVVNQFRNDAQTRLQSVLEQSETANQKFELFREASKKFTDLCDSLKSDELLKLKKEDPAKFEAECEGDRSLLESSFKEIEACLSDLKAAYEFYNQSSNYLALERRAVHAISERMAIFYQDSQSPPTYLLQDNSFHQAVKEMWSTEIQRLKGREELEAVAKDRSEDHQRWKERIEKIKKSKESKKSTLIEQPTQS